MRGHGRCRQWREVTAHAGTGRAGLLRRACRLAGAAVGRVGRELSTTTRTDRRSTTATRGAGPLGAQHPARARQAASPTVGGVRLHVDARPVAGCRRVRRAATCAVDTPQPGATRPTTLSARPVVASQVAAGHAADREPRGADQCADSADAGEGVVAVDVAGATVGAICHHVHAHPFAPRRVGGAGSIRGDRGVDASVGCVDTNTVSVDRLDVDESDVDAAVHLDSRIVRGPCVHLGVHCSRFIRADIWDGGGD